MEPSKTADVELMRRWIGDIFAFIEDVWGLVPAADKASFVKGKHLTHQQARLLKAISDGANGRGKRRIAAHSGHGVGKSSSLAMAMIWYLLTRRNAMVPVTAPTKSQMEDVLWKELALWIARMPKTLSDMLEMRGGYLCVRENPKAWFARARTASRDRPEALQGIHGEHVFILVDEASGVAEEVFEAGKGSLSGEDTLIVMLSNPTKLSGYFWRACQDRESWEVLWFDGEDSPIVSDRFVADILAECAGEGGRESERYLIRVRGIFPDAEGADADGWRPLFRQDELRQLEGGWSFRRPTFLGIDPAGGGQDEAVWVIRDHFAARVERVEKVSAPLSAVAATLDIMERHGIRPEDVTIDSFGIGATWATELTAALAREGRPGSPIPVNVGQKPFDRGRFLNARAEAYWSIREWMGKGGSLVPDRRWKPELSSIRMRRNDAGLMQVMGKDEMRRKMMASPGAADALMLTFVTRSAMVGSAISGAGGMVEVSGGLVGEFDRHAAAGGLF